MSIPALQWAFEAAVRGPAKAVLIVLANHAGADHRCWPSLDRIAAHAGLSKRTVQQAIASLAEQGFIVREGATGHRSATYLLTIAGAATVAGDATVAPDTTVAGDASPQWRELPQYSGGSCHLTIIEPSLEPKERLKVTKSPPKPPAGGFDAFWQVYPRKVGKGQARPAWDKAVRKAAPETIIAAVTATRWPTDPRYIPHPATWLRGERWLDEAQPHQPSPPPARLSATNEARASLLRYFQEQRK